MGLLPNKGCILELSMRTADWLNFYTYNTVEYITYAPRVETVSVFDPSTFLALDLVVPHVRILSLTLKL